MTNSPPDPFEHRPRRRWRRVSVTAPAGLTELVADLVAEASGAGVEVAAAPPAADGAARERVIGYFEDGQAGRDAEEALRAGLTGLAARSGLAGAIELAGEPLLEEDWGSGWKEHFRPFHATPGLVVKPSWERYEARPGEAVLEMDPGMAFGTGQHASTRLALAAVEAACAAAAPARALDVGTGTGILAMAAALRGARRVIAIDSDPDAVAAARVNVERNGLAGRVEVGGQQLEALCGAFALIVANITADVLLALRDAITARLAPGGTLVLAGLLAGEQAAEVRAAYVRAGLRCVEERAEGEWAALVLRRDGREEIFELVDEQGRVVGLAPRSACHADPSLLHRTAHVVVTDGSGRIYLQRRSASKDTNPGKWDTSVGGHLEPGEQPVAAARREMQEELGLAGELRFLYRYLWRTPRESELVETFLHLAAAEPRPDPGEIAEGRWFSVAAARELARAGQATPNLAEELRRLAGAGVL